MSVEENKAFVRRLIDEAWNQGNVDAVDQLIASTFIHHDPGNPDVRNREEYKQWLTETRTAFPDFHVAVEDEIAEGDQVVTRWTVRGTHQGELVSALGTIPATGKQIAVTGITIGHWVDGKLMEDWQTGDTLGFLQQLGVIPPP